MKNDESEAEEQSTLTEWNEVIGRHVRSLRVAAGISLVDCAARMTNVGCSCTRGRLSDLERGKYRWTARHWEAAGRVLGLEPWEMVPLPGGQDGLELLRAFRDHGTAGVTRWLLTSIENP